MTVKNFISLFAAAIMICNAGQMSAQKGKKKAPAPKVTAQADTSKAKVAKKTIPSLAKFIKPSAKISKGMTTVYEQDGRFFINIPDSLLGRDIRMVSRVSKSAEGIRGSFSGYAGDILNSALLRFEKGPNDKIFLRNILLRERSNSVMPQNVVNSNLPAIVASFDIKAQTIDKKESVIDVTDFLLSDPEYIFFNKRGKAEFKIGSLQKDKSYISGIKTYPINTEFKVVYTYGLQSGNPNATYELNSSFVLLPKEPMTPRYEDSRVGYFTVGYTDFDKNPQRVEKTRMITRWRLEPKPEDVEKYKRGELVEPTKPIVFYIDPATPKEWVPYLIAGVNDWEPVFRKAGFKNAIYALEAPTFEQDSTWSLEDARYSAIVYKPSDIPNASGPHINDPRSGEIIESHINWYHNVMSLLRNWYFIQCSPVDTAARKMTFSPELMGQLVRFVSSHEVGHTLGLRHNFAATSFYTADQLRDTAFLRKHGHTTSIMDYSRFNYVAQPGDNIPRELLFPRLSSYDDWVIEWGYRRFPEIDNPVKELPMINKWIIEKTKDPLYVFGTESDSNDPRLQAEDLGSNQMETNTLGVKNLKFIMKNLKEWTSEPNEDYSNLNTLYGEVLSQYRRYMNHVAKWIGGVYREELKVEQPGNRFTHVEKAKQKEAISFLKTNLFEPQLWLIPNDIMSNIQARGDVTIENTYASVLRNIVNKRVMLNLANDELYNGSKAYTMENLYTDLNNIILAPISTNPQKASLNRMLQKVYVESLIKVYKGESVPGRGPAAKDGGTKTDNSDITSLALYQLQQLETKFNRESASGAAINRAHYKHLAALIDSTINSKK